MLAYSQQARAQNRVNGNLRGDLPQGFWQTANGTYVNKPSDQASTSWQLNNLTAGDSQYIQQARNSAMAQAAARGLGNSSYAAGNAQGAAIRSALPIAQADAGMFAQNELSNQNALNSMEEGNRRNSTAISTAGIGAGAQVTSAQIAANANRYGQDQQTLRQNNQNQFEAGQGDINRQFQQNMLGLQNYYGAQDWARNLYGNVLQGAYGTMYSNPDYFSDPNAAMGFVNGFGNFANNQIDQFLYGNP
ncbi:MAG TPA: hypothetical protein VIY48_01590 [Candidatus Paceibacterota bacterium]